MSKWDRILADLHDTEDTDGAVAACKALDRAANRPRLPQLYRLLKRGRDFFLREAGETMPPSTRLTGPASSRRSVCAPGKMATERVENPGPLPGNGRHP